MKRGGEFTTLKDDESFFVNFFVQAAPLLLLFCVHRKEEYAQVIKRTINIIGNVNLFH